MRKEILKKLNKFLEEFEHKDDVEGVLVCGSFVTGHPNKHSDLDVHLLLNKKCKYRERGNRIVDGLLIEYFANTKRQILAYMRDDYQKIRPMSQTQFVTGEIVFDKTGELQTLKNEATKQLKREYEDLDVTPNGQKLYGVWDDMDDLQSILEEGRADFDFVYYYKLDRLLSCLFRTMKIPYNVKTIYGHLTSPVTRKKYLLKEIKDKRIRELVKTAIVENVRQKRLDAFVALSKMILEKYAFDIAKFSLKSDEEV